MTSKSWQTTLFGIVAAIATVIVESPELVDGDRSMILIAKIVMAVGIAGMGNAARDARVSDEESGAVEKPKAEPIEVAIVEQKPSASPDAKN